MRPEAFSEQGNEVAAILADVLSAVLVQEAEPTFEPIAPGPVAMARLSICDRTTGACTGVVLQVGAGLARVAASRMMSVADPAEEDVVDAVAELANVAAGGIKSLLYKHARLSLPSSEVVTGSTEASVPGSQQVRAVVLGHVVQLTVVFDIDPDGLLWPPVLSDELLGRP